MTILKIEIIIHMHYGIKLETSINQKRSQHLEVNPL